MTCATHSAVLHGNAAPRREARTDTSLRPGLLRRLLGVLFESRERAAEREAEVYLARTGGRFTDSIEREINECNFNGGWNLRR